MPRDTPTLLRNAAIIYDTASKNALDAPVNISHGVAPARFTRICPAFLARKNRVKSLDLR